VVAVLTPGDLLLLFDVDRWLSAGELEVLQVQVHLALAVLLAAPGRRCC
jgi:hypothetical protein